ncbi:hypothetical protein BFW01_g3152 [Lasiodiplodia theobromae]|nr:hypothetical protein BFW01_g3152 [Lasiodiplodia theobromae]
MKAFRISRAPAAAGDAAFDPFAKLVFEPALESDELFDALRESYPALKTHTERKKQAVLDFLMEERRAIEQEITAFVQHTGTPAPQPEACCSARPSPVFSTSSSLDLRKLSTSNSSSSSSTRSAGSSPETLSLKDMTSVWTAAGHGKPKIHTRRSMTTKEKEEYRRRRQMKACKECRSRKRKCNHDPSDASSAASSRSDAKVKKRTSTVASSHPPPSQQSFLSHEFDSASFLADSTFSTTDSPLDFLDLSPATGTEGSFDDFLLLPQDDFSSIDFATDPLFQPVPQSFAYDPFIEPQQSQQHYAPSTGSRSPASTYQSSGMSRSGSNAHALDTSQTWSFDLDPIVDISGGHVLDATFSTGSTDGKQSGLAAGLSRASHSSALRRSPTVQPSSTQTFTTRQSSHSLDGEISPGVFSGNLGTPNLGGGTSDSFLLSEGTRRQAASVGRAGHDALQPTAHSATPTHTLNAHTTTNLPGDVGVLPHALPDWFNDGRRDNARRDDARRDDARRDGLVLGTDPSAGSRFGEHGHSLAQRPLGASGRVGTTQHQVLPHPVGDGLLATHLSMWESHNHETEAPLSSRNPTSVNDPSSCRSGSQIASGLSPRVSPSSQTQTQSTTSVSRRHTVFRDGQDGKDVNGGIPGPASAIADARARRVSDSSADQALAVDRSCKGEEAKRGNIVDEARKPALADGASNELLSLAPVQTQPTSPRETDSASVIVASVFSTFVRTVFSSLLCLASATHEQDASSSRSCSPMEFKSSVPVDIVKARQHTARLSVTCTTSPAHSGLLQGVRRSLVFV